MSCYRLTPGTAWPSMERNPWRLGGGKRIFGFKNDLSYAEYD